MSRRCPLLGGEGSLFAEKREERHLLSIDAGWEISEDPDQRDEHNQSNPHLLLNGCPGTGLDAPNGATDHHNPERHKADSHFEIEAVSGKRNPL